MDGQTLFADTIFALSSGRLPAGVAVVRLSGAQTREAVTAMAGTVPQPRAMQLCSIVDRHGSPIDRGLVAFFPAPASFTGEDCAEFHLHGSKAVVAACLAALAALPGLRHAEAGEFTRRAFLNGKLDLTAAEGLADLIDAETEAQRRFALANTTGRQKAIYDGWRSRIIHARAMIEAELDFSDQEDVPDAMAGSVLDDMVALSAEIETHIASYRRAEVIRDGLKVVIVGPPNAGKSSLLNALARRDVAIVSDEPGTTRDLVEVSLDLAGLKVRLIDTAGIREAAGTVERMGIERAVETARTADLVLELSDSTEPYAAVPAGSGPRWVVGTKADLGFATASFYDFLISARSGEGVPALLEALERFALENVGAQGDVLPSRLRHVELLGTCLSALRSACSPAAAPLELRAEDLRRASSALGRIAGDVDVEDLLDTIFSTFCVGK